MGKAVANFTGGLIGTSDAEREAKKAEERAAKERERYEREMEKQRQAGLLDAANQVQNVTKVEVGGSADVSADMFSGTSKKKRKGADSSSLGVI